MAELDGHFAQRATSKERNFLEELRQKKIKARHLHAVQEMRPQHVPHIFPDLQKPAEEENLIVLSPLQLRIMARSASGLHTNVIAKEFFYSRDAIEWHIWNVRQKIKARNIVHAIAILVANGHISVPTGPELVCYPVFSRRYGSSPTRTP